MQDWQQKQYLPGAYTGHEMPFAVKQLGKKKWFRVWTVFYLIVFFAALVFGLIQMAIYIVHSK